jgi:hypothetical protein
MQTLRHNNTEKLGRDKQDDNTFTQRDSMKISLKTWREAVGEDLSYTMVEAWDLTAFVLTDISSLFNLRAIILETDLTFIMKLNLCRNNFFNYLHE